MANNGLFDFKSGIQFQPDVEARYQAWVQNPANAPAIMAAAHQRGNLAIGAGTGTYQAALDAGVLTPQDFANSVSNGSNIGIGPDGKVGIHEGITKGLGPALLAGGGMTALGLLAGPAVAGTGTTGATAGAQTLEDGTVVGGGGAAAADDFTQTPDLSGGGTSAMDIAKIAAKFGIPIGAYLGTHSTPSDPAANAASLLKNVPQLNDLLNLQVDSAKRSVPVQQAVQQMALNLLPKSSRSAYPGVPNVRGY